MADNPASKAAAGENGGAHQVLAIPAEVRRALAIPEVFASLDGGPGDYAATACFEMHSLSTVIQIQVTVDLRTNSPYTVLGGSLSGDLIGPLARSWAVTGSFGITGELTSAEGLATDSLTLRAEVDPVVPSEPQAEAVHGGIQSLIILGWLRPPLAYPGIWGVDGQLDPFSPAFYCTTLFKGWQPCS